LELGVRLGLFAGVFLLMTLVEFAVPRRRRVDPTLARWFSNLGLMAFNTAMLRLALPLTAVGAAALAGSRGWGVMSLWKLPDWLAVLATVVFLDFVVYGQHVVFHAIPVLWRVHRVHHADLDFDVTTGVRFHTLEILLSMGVKVAAVLLLGPPVWGVIAFETLLNATSMFNHANVRLPLALERILRLVLVTPDMHRVHHSALVCETNSNFGFNLSFWDRLLGTYTAQPRAGHEGMTIGLDEYRDPTCDRLPTMLAMPFSANEPSDADGRECRAGANAKEDRDTGHLGRGQSSSQPGL
jgi:sterol desaturase/sphingolipid hydroxylase (fatty acid hydroxylase superfamily)